ncbi:MAG: sigma-54-dependent Fis family transcriptional regulator [Firmicutes bacterium]|nr:sigma-54-dependent Fis family transcriptional regulator [Bacillota bacterium]MBQ6608731.1 sigma-54-dependent Fis family transcriptional regulator [Bacillota bacterium]
MSKYIKILIVDDEKASRETIQMLLENEGYSTAIVQSAEEAMEMLGKEPFHIVISDLMMPGINGIEFLKMVKEQYANDIEVIMATGYASVESAIEAMREGAFGYFIKGNSPEELLKEIEKALNRLELRHISENDAGSDYLLTTKSLKMGKIWNMVDLVAQAKAPVLITGESGTGKEIIAEQIHLRSERKDAPFVAVNCQQFPKDLIESELFGHEKGAFSGAISRRIGKLEQAACGTLFLDEIGDVTLNTQTKLLRVLENKVVERIGSNIGIPIDFRLISATNRPIREMIAEGRFREDLYYRLNTIEINVPPLRDRREDLPDLIDLFVRKYSKELGKQFRGIDDQTMEFLLTNDYRGNIRELRNIIERMVILSKNEGWLSIGSMADQDQDSNGRAIHLPYKEAKARFEKEYIREMLEEYDGNITRTAENMGLSRRQLFNKITEYGIDAESYKDENKK